MFFIYELNFRTRLSLSIYLFFNNKRRYFAMRVATASHKVAAVLQETGRSAIGSAPWSFRWWRHLHKDIGCLADAFPATSRSVGATVKVRTQWDQPIL
jgi:hypothetical protein